MLYGPYDDKPTNYLRIRGDLTLLSFLSNSYLFISLLSVFSILSKLHSPYNNCRATVQSWLKKKKRKMDLDSNPTISQAHPETMDFLSRTWCNFAVQAFQPEMQDQALILHENSIKNLNIDNKPPIPVSNRCEIMSNILTKY